MATTQIEMLPVFETQLEEKLKEVRALQQVVEGLRILNGHAPRIRVSGGEQTAIPGVAAAKAAAAPPRGIHAVLAITGEKPGTWTRARILREFKRRRWFHTTDRRKAEGAVDAAIHRLIATGRAEKIDSGVYKFPATNGREVS